MNDSSFHTSSGIDYRYDVTTEYSALIHLHEKSLHEDTRRLMFHETETQKSVLSKLLYQTFELTKKNAHILSA